MANALELLREKAIQLNGGKGVKFPLPKLQIDQTKGLFVIREGETVSDSSDTVEVYLLKKYGEYIYFDPEKEKITKRTTIETNPKDCREIVSGLTVEELREAGYKMTFIASYVGFLLLEDGRAKPAVLQLKGAALKSLIDYMSDDKEYAKNRSTYALRLTLKVNKKGRVEYYTPAVEKRVVSEAEASEILSKMDEIVSIFEEFRAAYNSPKKATGTEEEVSAEEFSDTVDF